MLLEKQQNFLFARRYLVPQSQHVLKSTFLFLEYAKEACPAGAHVLGTVMQDRYLNAHENLQLCRILNQIISPSGTILSNIIYVCWLATLSGRDLFKLR